MGAMQWASKHRQSSILERGREGGGLGTGRITIDRTQIKSLLVVAVGVARARAKENYN